jgi:hypothetical protein
MRYLSLALLLISNVCFAQTSQPPATPEEIKYLRFILLNVASLDHSPDAIKAFEDSLVKQFGLVSLDSAAIHSAGLALNSLLAQNRQSLRTIVAGRTVLSPADLAALADLDAQREKTIATLANQILNSVSPVVAVRLRTAGHILANALHQN